MRISHLEMELRHRWDIRMHDPVGYVQPIFAISDGWPNQASGGRWRRSSFRRRERQFATPLRAQSHDERRRQRDHHENTPKTSPRRATDAACRTVPCQFHSSSRDKAQARRRARSSRAAKLWRRRRAVRRAGETRPPQRTAWPLAFVGCADPRRARRAARQQEA